MAHLSPSDHLYGIVDMGSNGIRFSISDLSFPTARSVPTIFQSRSSISLYDAQYSTDVHGFIPQSVTDSVIEALQRFKITCEDFGVPHSNIKVLATEATRTAVNSEDYRRQIKEATRWEVEMLAKETEGKIGAMGIASSFQEVEGLVMDLGGGSTQITWMISKDGDVQTSPKGSISFPYGAAALRRRLEQVETQDPTAKESLAKEMQSNFSTAYHDLNIPAPLFTKAEQEGGFTLYLSGGGFRGWGYLLMSQSKINPYPIPIINGFSVSRSEFQTTTQMQYHAATSSDIFRVSKRRAAQVPAVAFLIHNLCLAIPNIKTIRFCQGGVREGYLFNVLDRATRALDPLVAATAKYVSFLTSIAATSELLLSSLPSNTPLHHQQPQQQQQQGAIPLSITSSSLLRALSSLLYLHSSYPKESASLSALYTPITGALASAHGVSHSDRALLALILCQRWDGDLAPPHGDLRARLAQLLSREEVWWCGYLGTVAGLIGDVCPAGMGSAAQERLRFRAEWAWGLGKKGEEEEVGVRLVVVTGKGMASREMLDEKVQAIQRLGKKRNRIGGREAGFGLRVQVQLEAVPDLPPAYVAVL